MGERGLVGREEWVKGAGLEGRAFLIADDAKTKYSFKGSVPSIGGGGGGVEPPT